jgi:hypothetical protein
MHHPSRLFWTQVAFKWLSHFTSLRLVPHPRRALWGAAASRHPTNARHCPETPHKLCPAALYITYYSLCPGSSQGAHRFYPLAQLAMSMAGSGPVFTLAQLQASALRRRSSCPSIPRSVSICSSVSTFDSSSEDLSYSRNLSELNIYMSPLFRGVGTNEVGSIEDTEGDSNTPTEVCDPRTDSDAIDCDDGLSETLSNYNFDLTGHEHVSESREGPEGDPEEQSLESPLVPNEPSDSKESYLPSPTQPSPTLEHYPSPLLPPVPSKMPRQMMPSSMGTRPLQINRSKKRQESSTTPQSLSGGDAQYERPPLKSILKTTTQVDLHGAYRRTGSLAEKKVYSRGVVPVVPSPLQTRHPKVPNVNEAEVISVHRIIVVTTC